jgi:hypothetical protein
MDHDQDRFPVARGSHTGAGDALRDILAPHLAAAVDIDALPQTLRTPAGLARAVTTIYDGATIQLLVDPDQEALRRWLQDVLVGLLDRAAEEPT